MSEATFVVGQRLLLYPELSENSLLCTVRYIGKLHTDASANRLWLGLEVDPLENDEECLETFGVDGCLGNKRYFHVTDVWPRTDHVTGLEALDTSNRFHFKRGLTQFIPVSSVQPVQRGHSFLDALYFKYYKPLTSGQPIYIGGTEKGKCGKRVEFVGFADAEKHFRNLAALEFLDVNNFYVNCYTKHTSAAHKTKLGNRHDEQRDIEETSVGAFLEQLEFTNARSLSLARSLLFSVRQLFTIISKMPNLETLILSETRFARGLLGDAVRPPPGKQLPHEIPLWHGLPATERFPLIKYMELKQTEVEWADLRYFARIFPNLVSLDVSKNPLLFDELGLSQLTKLANDSKAQKTSLFPLVHTIKAQQCNIHSYQDICALCKVFPKMRTLAVNGNCLSDVSLATLEGHKTFFDLKDNSDLSLQQLWIEDNLVSKCETLGVWSRFFPLIENLRWQGNPVAQLPELQRSIHSEAHSGEPGTATQTYPPALLRQIVIAIFPKLCCLNGGDISASERRQTEIYYLSLVARKASIITLVDPDQYHAKRLKKLYQIGLSELPEESSSQETLSGNATTKVVTVKLSPLYEVESESSVLASTDFIQVTREFPLWLPLKDLKVLCEKLFTIPASNQKLFLTFSDHRCSRIPLVDDECSLGSYGVSNGSHIMVKRET